MTSTPTPCPARRLLAAGLSLALAVAPALADARPAEPGSDDAPVARQRAVQADRDGGWDEGTREAGGWRDWDGPRFDRGPRGGHGRPLRAASGLCVDIRNNGGEGAPAILYGCHGGANQRFDWGRDGELRVNGQCLDVAGANWDNGARVIAYRCNGQPNQRWQLRGGQVRSRLNGKCLDVPEGRARPGQTLQLWDCHGGDNQRWRW